MLADGQARRVFAKSEEEEERKKEIQQVRGV
jgi:hypothetical protein